MPAYTHIHGTGMVTCYMFRRAHPTPSEGMERGGESDRQTDRERRRRESRRGKGGKERERKREREEERERKRERSGAAVINLRQR